MTSASWLTDASSPARQLVLSRANDLIRRLGLDVSGLWKGWNWAAIGKHASYESAIMEDFRNLVIPHYRYYDAVSATHLTHFLKDVPRTAPVLDVGAGSGNHSILLMRDLGFTNVTLLDIAPERLQLAREKIAAERLTAKATFVVGDVTKPETISLPNRYALAFAVGGILSYTGNLRAAVATVAAALLPDGKLLGNLHNRVAELKHAVWEGNIAQAQNLAITGRDYWAECYTPTELDSILEAAGFRSRMVAGQYFFFLPEVPDVSPESDRLVSEAVTLEVRAAFLRDFVAAGSYLLFIAGHNTGNHDFDS